MSNNNPGHSLVKYNTPILVSTSKGGKKKSVKELPPLKESGATSNEDLLNEILPPREYTQNGQLWIQYVSSTPATRVDVTNLKKELDTEIDKRQAIGTGICPLREELYTQCFDELIRQITINCNDRGYLLVKVRNEINMTIQAYQSLYESAISSGMRKALQSEQNKNDMADRIRQLEDECLALERESEDLEIQVEETVKIHEEIREKETSSHKKWKEEVKLKLQEYRNDIDEALSNPHNHK
ncbi:unnamed protein product [Moneuplotes crassus]|uniref:Uncharacterized protein n=1 Tax=Euplotes crassus TaxID=5936 RepID=A0AAD2D370_EUPCR|nr:unnamed protein product [Moneuplotes crassus]